VTTRQPPARPLYARVLRLRHLRLPTWQRIVFEEVTVAVGIVLALAEVASAWVILVLPVAVAAMVKFNDVLIGLLAESAEPDRG
jgi:molybdopterin biosynthesis enzyme